MAFVDRDFSAENPSPGSEKLSSCEGFTLSISLLKRQIGNV
jgi:hypothetical protein